MCYEPQARGNQEVFSGSGYQVDVKHSSSTLRAMLAEKYVAILLCPYLIYWLC